MLHLLRKTPSSSKISPLLSSVQWTSSSFPRRRWLLPKKNDGSWNGFATAKTASSSFCVPHDYSKMSSLVTLSIRNNRLYYSTATRVRHQQESGTSSNSSITSNSISKRLELEIDKVRSKVHWNLSDFFSVVSAFSLLTAIIFGPYVVEKMKKSKNSYEDLVVDDEFTNLMQVFQEYRKEVLNTEESSTTITSINGNNPMVSLVIDICKQVIDNPDVQQSLQSLVVRILKSPSVQVALQDLSLETTTKLLQDKELQKQVIQLFQGVLADEQFQSSAVTLLVSLLQNETFQAELINMIVRIGQNEKVVEATKALLTESAHKTLVDPEILDHSMEFAADVVGDDFVQRTSGEALWNTISYSIQPAFFSILYFSGAMLLAFSFVALSKAQFYSNMAAFASLDTKSKTWWWWFRWASWEYLGQQLRSLAEDLLIVLVKKPCWALTSSAKSVTSTLWRNGTSWIHEYLFLKSMNFIYASSCSVVNGLTASATVGWVTMKHTVIYTASIAGTRITTWSRSLQQAFVKSTRNFGSYCYGGIKWIVFDYPISLFHQIRFHFLQFL